MKQEFQLQAPGFSVSNIHILEVVRSINDGCTYRNGRNKHGFVYVIRGSMRDTFFEKDLPPVVLHAGDLMFIPQGCAYVGDYLEENTQIKIVQFELASGVLPEYLSQPGKLELPNAKALIDAFFRMNPGSGHQFYFFACMYSLLWQIDESYTSRSVHYAKIRPAVDALKRNSEANHKMDHYAKLCNMSEGNFRRLFRECIGKSPVDYRNDIRLTNARALLQSGEFNVSEAAEATGFTNHSFFIRLYKKKYGHTPKQDG